MATFRTLPVSYTTVELVKETLPKIKEVSNLSSGQIAMFAGRAQARVNGMIVRKYTLPFTAEVPELEDITTVIAIYNILAQNLGKDLSEDSQWPDLFKDALSRLEDIGKGTVKLVTTSGDLIGARTDLAEIWSNNQTYNPTFHEGSDLDSFVDPDKIADIKGDRGL